MRFRERFSVLFPLDSSLFMYPSPWIQAWPFTHLKPYWPPQASNHTTAQVIRANHRLKMYRTQEGTHRVFQLCETKLQLCTRRKHILTLRTFWCAARAYNHSTIQASSSLHDTMNDAQRIADRTLRGATLLRLCRSWLRTAPCDSRIAPGSPALALLIGFAVRISTLN